MQIEGDQNTVQIGPRPKLLLTRFVAQRRIPAGKAVSELLQLSPYTLSTTLVGRDAELADLDRFLHSTESISVRVLTGDGGSGKTRLALHLCEQMADQGWLTGFATSDALRKFNTQPDRAEWGWSRPTLVVIDYAASHTELLKDWLDALADRLGQEPALEHPLRILLLERHATHESGWMAELCANGGWAAIGGRHTLFDPPEPVAVRPLTAPADRARLLNQMLQRNGFIGPQVSPEFVERHLSTASWGQDPLFLMMAALHAVQQGRIEALALRRTDLAQELARREGVRLDRLAAVHQPAPLNKQLLRHLNACITLAQGMDRDAFLPLVSQESQATGRPNGGDPAEFHDLLADALPATDDGCLPPLLPDLIGEAFVLDTLAAQKINSTGLQRLYATLGLPMVQTLVRCAQDFAKQDTNHPLPWLRALVQVASGDWQRLVQISQAIPHESVVLRGLNLEIVELRDKALAEWPEASPELKAWHLSQASIARAEMGQREEALESAREAVEIRRELARQRPDAFRPDLASSLNNLANRLSDLGQREEALEAACEAVEIYRELARQRPDAFRPDLAMSLNNVANRLSDLGQREEALAAAREAVEIRRELARQRPDAFRPDLAMSLNNVASFLSALGQREEALAAAREAVEIYRELARQRPDAFRPNLAMSLNNVANVLSALGQREEALAAAREAVEIYRELARQRPDAF
ncbi:tetratricopeptide repeat protein, partial [Sphaerotilus uruguayifluvii]|uniref:tetratricopeptide repeat protein n=1 Tax=Sphaerotilus uruguayifluvii TaxID=2735897 RepID=UPI001C2CCC31